MSIFEKSRFEIWNQSQHPYKHSLTDFAYNNPALPGVSDLNAALNYIVAVLYPNAQPAVADPASLPLVGNSIGDFRVVQDDGDGRQAAYRWEQREGDASPQWYKVMDMDWANDSILGQLQDITQDLYVYQKGKSDTDENGNAIVGLYAGQRIYGGNLANQNLTFNANFGDGVGAQTGYIQSDGNFRPTLDNTYDLSTATERWANGYFGTSIVVDTMTISSGTIIDSTGSISFDNENLITTGNINGSIITASNSLVVDTGVNSVTIVPGSYTDTSGTIDFGASNLITTGSFGSNTITITEGVQTLTLDADNGSSQATILSSLGAINFGSSNLSGSGTVTFTNTATFNELFVDNLRLDGNFIRTPSGNMNIEANGGGAGTIFFRSPVSSSFAITTTNNVTAGTLVAGNVFINGNSINTLSGSLLINSNGSSPIVTVKDIIPDIDDQDGLGNATFRYDNLFLSQGISDGTNTIAMSTLLAFRSGVWRDLAQSQPAQNGDGIFYDAVNGVWLASAPDSEIDHSTVSGLTTGDAGHTQFVMLAGRSGGQTIQGGTGVSENLTLESTSNATKGSIYFSDVLAPLTNASFSGGWAGTDIGDSTHYIRDLYSKGEFFGLRLENTTTATLPASSSQNVGRVVFNTDNNKAYVDTGVSMVVLGVSKFVSDIVWNGTDTTKDVDVSASIEDARNAQWQLKDNANNFEIMAVTLKATSATNVRIEVAVPLAAGSYRLIGVE